MENSNELRGEVLKQFRSISAFGKECGWTRQKTHRIVEHQTEPSIVDICKMSNVLNVSITRMVQFFLP